MTGINQPAPAEWCDTYHCPGDCGLRHVGAPVAAAKRDARLDPPSAGEILRTRIAANMLQADAARIAGVTERCWRRWEAGQGAPTAAAWLGWKILAGVNGAGLGGS